MNRVRPSRTAVVSALSLLFSASAAIAEPRFKTTLGYEYNQGSYGQSTDTRQHSLPFSLTLQNAGWSLQASSSWLSTRGPSDLISIDGSPTATSTGSTQGTDTNQGFGDTTLRIKKELAWGADKGIFLDINAAVRLATASSSANILHRKPDYSLQLDSFISRGRWMPMASLGYKWMGNGDNYAPRNVWLASAGIQYQLDNRCSLGGIADYRQRLTATGDPLQEVMGYLACPLNSDWTLTSYLLTGFSDSSLDQGAGIQLSWRQPRP